MGWDNPPVPWRELQRRPSWGAGEPADDDEADRSPPRPVTRLPAPAPAAGPVPPWAELHCHSSYSFLDGASSPAELVAEAARRGLEALAITDHNGMYGVPQFAQAAAKLADQTGVTLGTVFGAELSVNPLGIERAGAPDPAGQHLLVLARDPDGYRRLCWAIRAALAARGATAARKELGKLQAAFGRDNVVIELTGHDLPEDDERNDALYELARSTGTTAIATGNVDYAAPGDTRLAEAL